MSKKISQLTTATDVTVNDFFQVVDLEDPTMASSGTNKKVSAQTLGNFLPVTATGSSASRSLKDRFADTVNVKDFGAIGDGVTDDTGALNAAIAAAQLGSKSMYFPAGVYKITSKLTSITGGTYTKSWSITGAGIGASTIKATFDGPVFSLNTSTEFSLFGLIQNLSFEGSNTGSDVASVGFDVIASATSATGAKWWRIIGCSFARVRYGVRFQDTGKAMWDGFPAITSHGYLYMEGCVVRPDGPVPVEIGFYSVGAFGLHSTFNGNTFRGSVATVRLGSGLDNNAVGDILFTGNHFVSGAIALDIRGPSNGAYNQNVTVTGSQFDNVTVNTVKFSNMKNFRIFANNSTSGVGFSFIVCSDYIAEDRNHTSFMVDNTTFANNVNTTLAIINDTNGLRFGQSSAIRRSVNTDRLQLSGGNAMESGAQLRLYGGTNESLPDYAILNGSIVLQNKDKTVSFLEAIDGTNVCKIGSGAWNSQSRLALGTYQFWVDNSGRLRIKNGTPTSDTDGTIVGSQV